MTLRNLLNWSAHTVFAVTSTKPLHFAIAAASCLGFSEISGKTATLQEVYQFPDGPAVEDPSGYSPSGLIEGRDGFLYGTTELGGEAQMGTVFKISKSGGLPLVVHHFQAAEDGLTPQARLTMGADGTLFGVGSGNYGFLPVGFRISTNGTFSVFADSCFATNTWAGTTIGTLTRGTDGHFYGLSADGGLASQGSFFKLTTNGYMTLLYSFTNQPDAFWYNYFLPFNIPTMTQIGGNFYGVSLTGGTNGNGEVFQISTAGKFKRLYTFPQAGGGAGPQGLTVGPDGNLYGVAHAGGSNGGGMVFKITSTGIFSTVASFSAAIGTGPNSPLLAGSDGNFYGTSCDGSGFGTVYRVSLSGVITKLADITAATQDGIGADPLIEGNDGNLYGSIRVVVGGGLGHGGVIYRVTEAIIPTTFGTVPIGTYNGLFFENGSIAHQSSGYFTFSLANTRKFSGKLLMDGNTYIFTNSFPPNVFSATAIALRTNRPSDLTVTLNLSQLNGGVQVIGTVSDGNWTAQLNGDRAYFSATATTPRAGKYSVAFLNESDGTVVPGYGSSAVITLGANGVIGLNGKLSDDTMISQATTLSKSGQMPLYISLYGGKGSMLGWLTFADTPTTKINGAVSWIKAQPYGTSYVNGFTNTVNTFGAIRR
jgi:uncharacterized repeat protein (TIGR03803 family)